MRNKRFRKKSGFILLPVILAMFIVGLLGVGLASMYSGTFSTLQAGQVASQAKQYANIEAAAIKARGYDDAESGAHGWQDMTSLVGSEDGSKWQSKVETMRTDTTPDGNNVKVMKVSTRKNGELVSRYSEEIPVVEGLDVYSKDEIDSMFSTVDHQIGTLTTDLTNLTTRMTNAESSITNLSGDINTINSNIDSINADLDTLQKMINANTSLINEETSYRKTADTNLQNNINKEANARTSAVNAINLQINSLKSTLSNLQGALTSEANARKASDSTLQSNINSEASARAKAIQDLAAEVNNKYTELKNLYDGIKGRLDGKEFVRSKDAANNISLKYEQLAGEDKKSIHAYVDGNLVPLASQNGSSQYDVEFIQDEIPEDITINTDSTFQYVGDETYYDGGGRGARALIVKKYKVVAPVQATITHGGICLTPVLKLHMEHTTEGPLDFSIRGQAFTKTIDKETVSYPYDLGGYYYEGSPEAISVYSLKPMQSFYEGAKDSIKKKFGLR